MRHLRTLPSKVKHAPLIVGGLDLGIVQFETTLDCRRSFHHEQRKIGGFHGATLPEHP